MKYKLSEIASVTKLAGFEFTKYIKYIPDGEIIAIRALNLKDGTLILNDVRRIASSVSESLERSKLYINDIVLSYTGTIGECAQITENGKYHLAPNVCKVTPNTELVDPDYLFQYVRSPLFRQLMMNYCHGSTQPTIPMATIRELPIDIPFNIVEQRKVAKTLKILDRKVELNNAINCNLEQQAQAIFENIFNDCSDFCELNQAIHTTSGGTPSRKKDEYYKNGNIYWVKSKELSSSFIADTEEKITEMAIKNSSAKLLPKHSVIIAMYGATVGEYGIITKEMACNQAICALIPNNNYPYTYLFMFAKLNKQNLINLSVGSAQQNISQVLIKGLSVCSDIERIKSYHKLVSPLFKKIEALIEENQRLNAIRDTLLPKLINGEIDVSKVQI